MRKKLLSALLVLTLVFSLCSAMTVSASAAKDVAEVVGGQKYETIQEAFNAAKADSEGAAKTVKLLMDIDMTDQQPVKIESGKYVILDLNGFVLSATNVITKHALIKNFGTLTIKDSNPTNPHYYKYNPDGAWTLTAESENAIEVSKIKSKTAEGTIVKVLGGGFTYASEDKAIASVINFNGATMTIERANFVGNNSLHLGTLYNLGGTLYFKAGQILGNSAYEGAGISSENGSTSIGTEGGNNSDVLIAYNIATEYAGAGVLNYANTTSTLFSDVYTRKENEVAAFMTIHCATIRNNKALKTPGGGVCNYISDNSSVQQVIMEIEDAIITDNEAVSIGGGIFHQAGEGAHGIIRLYIKGGNISGNKASNILKRNIGGTAPIDDETKVKIDIDLSKIDVKGILKSFEPLINYGVFKYSSWAAVFQKISEILATFN